AEFSNMEIDPSLLSQADNQKHGQYRNAVANILEVLGKDRLSRSEVLPELCKRLDVGETTARTTLGKAIPTRAAADEDFVPVLGQAFPNSQYRLWIEQGPTVTSPVTICGERAADPIQPTPQDKQVASAVELIRKHPNGIYQAELLNTLKGVLQISEKEAKALLKELRLIPLIEVIASGRHRLFRYQSEITLCNSANSATDNPLHSCETP
ncbi:MAG: hypothetical protein N0C86_21625, partial [Candidatus Thiodiazotropha taylori]|nr:hypothetical protein [Candidatus Thiodiazotropha taylori]MCW4328599.1 hypothetical protein [Candidatus Thiodiazotropha taylori]